MREKILGHVVDATADATRKQTNLLVDSLTSLAQGHNKAEVGIEPKTSGLGVMYSTTR